MPALVKPLSTMPATSKRPLEHRDRGRRQRQDRGHPRGRRAEQERVVRLLYAFELWAPYKPLEQLLAVLPSASNYVLLRAYHEPSELLDLSVSHGRASSPTRT